MSDAAGQVRRRPQTRHLRRAAAFLWPYKGWVALATVALLVGSGAVLGLGQGLRLLVDHGFAAGDAGMLDLGLGLLMGLVAVMAASFFVRAYTVSWLGERVVADMRDAVYRNLLRQDVAFYETTRTGDLVSRLNGDTALLQGMMGAAVSMVVRHILMFLGALGLMLATDVSLSLLALIVVPLLVAPVAFVGRRVRSLSREARDRMADVGARAEESLNAIRTVQASVQEITETTRFSEGVEAAFQASRRHILTRSALFGGGTVLVFACMGALLWVGGHRVIDGTLSAGALSAFLFYAMIVSNSASNLAEVAGNLFSAAGAVDRLMELLGETPTVAAPAEPVPLPQPPQGAVTFEGVTFHYPARPDIAALEGFDLAVKPGEVVALVGPSGAGKSTVFQLLLRFYDPAGGRVCFDGVDLRAATPQDVRRRIGLVPQDPVIFSTSALENIRYGRPDAAPAEVRAAAEAARALDFVEALPDGFDTFLGEKGVRLSGGQKQRIAIARALLRDPCLLLLDEATSALDAENERLVQQALEGLMRGRTTLVIAHRLATVVHADRIVVMDGGRVVATGRHDALMETSPLYARLAALQFSAPIT